MTCIVAIKHKGLIYMGCDSAGCAGYEITDRADKKIFGKAGYIFGFAGSYRVGQIVKYSFIPPKNERATYDEYIHTDFVNGLRACLDKGGCLKKDGNLDLSVGMFLIGSSVDSKIYCLETDFQIAETLDDYESIGSGAHIAKGSLYSTEYIKEYPLKRIEIALTASEKFISSVRRPFFTITTKKNA
jgi:ATP-dependent protease HslVU (ClpYQ) peptidase subunit